MGKVERLIRPIKKERKNAITPIKPHIFRLNILPLPVY